MAEPSIGDKYQLSCPTALRWTPTYANVSCELIIREISNPLPNRLHPSYRYSLKICGCDPSYVFDHVEIEQYRDDVYNNPKYGIDRSIFYFKDYSISGLNSIQQRKLNDISVCRLPMARKSIDNVSPSCAVVNVDDWEIVTWSGGKSYLYINDFNIVMRPLSVGIITFGGLDGQLSTDRQLSADNQLNTDLIKEHIYEKYQYADIEYKDAKVDISQFEKSEHESDSEYATKINSLLSDMNSNFNWIEQSNKDLVILDIGGHGGRNQKHEYLASLPAASGKVISDKSFESRIPKWIANGKDIVTVTTSCFGGGLFNNGKSESGRLYPVTIGNFTWFTGTSGISVNRDYTTKTFLQYSKLYSKEYVKNMFDQKIQPARIELYQIIASFFSEFINIFNSNKDCFIDLSDELNIITNDLSTYGEKYIAKEEDEQSQILNNWKEPYLKQAVLIPYILNYILPDEDLTELDTLIYQLYPDDIDSIFMKINDMSELIGMLTYYELSINESGQNRKNIFSKDKVDSDTLYRVRKQVYITIAKMIGKIIQMQNTSSSKLRILQEFLDCNKIGAICVAFQHWSKVGFSNEETKDLKVFDIEKAY